LLSVDASNIHHIDLVYAVVFNGVPVIVAYCVDDGKKVK
jgi:hypothetical protein